MISPNNYLPIVNSKLWFSTLNAYKLPPKIYKLYYISTLYSNFIFVFLYNSFI